MLDEPVETDEGAATAKVYYADELATEFDAAFIVEGWDWIVGFDQVDTPGEDYVTIPTERAIAVRSPKYTTFTHGGHRVTAYGVDETAHEYADRLPL